MTVPTLRLFVLASSAVWSVGSVAVAASDPGRKACIVDARRLCPAAMNTMRRSKVEACMIARIDQTSPGCHAEMLRIKAAREGAGAH